MVVGKGLVANAFLNRKGYDNLIIFASGVSNSDEKSDAAYQREWDLLLKYENDERLLVYFSTCSIYDKSLKTSLYVKHKLEIEELIKTKFKNYMILRLPTLVGNSTNPHTFFNYFKNNLIESKDINVYKKASRYLLDVDDLPAIVNLILISNNKNIQINVAFNNKEKVTEIVNIMRDKLQSKSNVFINETGDELLLDNSFFLKLIENSNYVFNSNPVDIIEKYI